MKYSIIIVAYKAEDKLNNCLLSLAEHMPERSLDGPAEIIIVDNNEDQDCKIESKTIYALLKNQIEGYCSIEVVKAGKNIGYAAGANLGASYAEGRYLIFVNPDTIVYEGWCDGLLKAMLKYDDVGAVGPVSNYVAGFQNYMHHLERTEDHPEYAKLVKEQYNDLTLETDMLIGFFLMTKKSVFNEVGCFDPDLFLGCDDLDYSLKLKDKGYKMIIALSSYVQHIGHESFKSNPKSESLIKQTEEIYCNKLFDKYKGEVPEAIDLWGVPMINTQINEKPVKLSVCMIVRKFDEKLTPLLKKLSTFADEIVCVETKHDKSEMSLNNPIDGTDTTLIVSRFPWNDSFADARNYSLGFCTGDWVLWVDDDDDIPEGTGPLIRAILDKPGPVTKSKMCHFVLRIKDMGQGVFYCNQPRLFPNSIGMEWKGRVHENYLDAAGKLGLMPVIVDNIEIIHTGYADIEVNKKKSERNIKLLEMEPDTEEKYFHLGKQYHSLEEQEKAVEYYKKALKITPITNIEGRDHLRFSIALCEYQKGNFQSLSTLDYIIDNSKKDSLFLMAEWLFQNKENEDAKKYYQKYLDLGKISDVRGTHQESFREGSKKRLEELNELTVQ